MRACWLLLTFGLVGQAQETRPPEPAAAAPGSEQPVRRVPSPAAAQPDEKTDDREDEKEKKKEERRSRFGRLIPLPLEEPRVIAGRIVPLTPGQKARLMVRNTIGAGPIANRIFWSAINQWEDHPSEWGQGWDAYGHRLWSRTARMSLRNSIRLAGDLAFRTDPRYHRCDCTGGLPRTWHAITRTFVTRKDSGTHTFNSSRVIAAMTTPWISDQWYPPRLNTTSHHFSGAFSYLGWNSGTNLLREFWPEIRRILVR